jgi:cation diffusion facilitator family transporter
MKPLHHQSSARKALRITAVGLVVSAVLAVVKGVGGVMGNSYALIADAIESSADIFTSGMMWLGLRWSQRPPDNDHPYGHGKGEALITLGIAFVLVAAATLIGTKSVQNIITPHKIPAPYTLIILVVVIATKELLYRVVLKTGRELGSGAVEADAIHHRSDAITSVAAFIGIAIGLVGGPGFEVADDYAAMFASIIIVINAVKIARPAIGELLDEELDPNLNRDVVALAAGVEKVSHVERCRIRKMGPFKIADLHIWVDKNLTVEEGHRISHEVKDLIQTKHPLFSDVMIHIEPSK